MSKQCKNRVSLSVSFLPYCNRNELNKVLSHVCRHFFLVKPKNSLIPWAYLEGTVINDKNGILLDHSTYVDLHKMYLHKFLRYICLKQLMKMAKLFPPTLSFGLILYILWTLEYHGIPLFPYLFKSVLYLNQLDYIFLINKSVLDCRMLLPYNSRNIELTSSYVYGFWHFSNISNW